LAPVHPFDMSGHVKNGFALDWRSDPRINTQRYTKVTDAGQRTQDVARPGEKRVAVTKFRPKAMELV